MGEFESRSLVWIIVLPIAFASGMALMCLAVIRRWKRDDKEGPIMMYRYDQEPGMPLEERVRRIHEARALHEEEVKLRNEPPPPTYAPPPAYTSHA